MKNRILMPLVTALTIMIFCCGTFDASAQKKAEKPKVVTVVSQVTDEAGNPVSKAAVITGEGAITLYTDASGRFTLRTKDNSVILIEAEGYKDYVLDLRVLKAPTKIVLESEAFLAGERDMLDRMDGAYTSQHDLTAAIGTVDIEKLKKYPDLNISNGLQGQAAGLIVRSINGGLGYNGAEIYIRGLHAGGTQAIVVIDGIERPMDDITAEEIETIQVLKDAPAKVLYGPRATNGVLLITTKRGQANKKIIRATAEYGVSPSTRVPKWLGSYDYATLYNEARQNDGLPNYYLDYQLEGYKNSTGENDLLYPDVDWYGRFTRNMSTYRKAIVEFNGGTDRVRYALTAGYTGGSGLEKVGKRSDLNRINLRGNLDIGITDFLTVTADVAARLEIKNWGGLDGAAVYSTASSNRPNEYPLTINAEDIGMEPNEDGSPYYGASVRQKSNMLVDMGYGGNTSERYVNSQTNFGIKLDLDKYVKGLFADAYITFDNYNYLRQQLSKTFATYAVDSYLDENGEDALRVAQMKKVNENDDINISSEQTTRQIGWRANAGYERTFGKHTASIVAAFRYYKDEKLGANQNVVTTNFTPRLNYSYDSKYFAEVVLGVMGSNQLAKSNRFMFTPVVSAGWVISNEPFMKSAGGVDFLKLKASYGLLGFFAASNYLLYNTAWNTGGSYATGNTNNVGEYIMNLGRIGNPNLGWVTSSEWNVGVEGVFLDKCLRGEANWFREMRRGTIGKNGVEYSEVVGDYLPSTNVGDVLNQGVDAYLSWSDILHGGDFKYTVGVNFTYTKNKVVKASELTNIEEYRKTVGRPTSAIFGQISEGLFGRDVDLEGHPRQAFGYYTTGDIAYKDLNNDSVIDDRDETMIGQSFPVTTWGIDVDLQYKGFGLYVLGTAETGASALLSNAYYWNNGADSYSVKALDRWHPVNNPDGTLPRLTTTTGSNSYRNSDFWIEDASFFRLKNVELSYTFNNYKAKGVMKQIKVFLRGTNLCVISKIKDLDPERLDAGITNYPVYRTFTGGLSFTF